MTKYKTLNDHLAARSEPFWRISFDELEAVLGFPLPKAAHDSSGWWANEGEKGHNRAWLDAGWRVESVDRPGQAVLFHREGYEPADELPERYFTPPPPEPPATPHRRLSHSVGTAAIASGALALTAALGALAFQAFRKRK